MAAQQLTDHNFLRYGRQLLLADWGESGQLSLANKTVLIIGLGGLGCPALQYLAGAGIGHLRLVDGDTVSLSNLPRQTLYSLAQIGQRKVNAANAWLQQHNPELKVEAIPQMASAEQLPDLLAGVDVVLDCTDNLAIRHQINAACVQAQVPLISGAAIGWQGQLLVIAPHLLTKGACFACISDPTEQPQADSCQAAGIVGPVVGMVGMMQALAAIKLLLGQPIDGQLRRFNGHSMQWQSFVLPSDPHCTVCGALKQD